MKHILILVAFLAVLLTGCEENEEAKAVRNTFESYKKALLASDGKEASKYIDDHSVQYYDMILDKALHADSVELARMDLLDKMSVLTMKHMVSPADLKRVDGIGLFILGTSNGLTAQEQASSLSLGKISVKGNFAEGQVLYNDQETPIQFHFYKVDGAWKIDLTSIFPITRKALAKIFEESILDENEIILMTLQYISDSVPDNSIWHPIES